VLAEMERRFKQPRDQLRPTLRRQTQVPVRGTYLKNPNGTAVGLVFETEAGVVVALPGPPRELQPMVTTELVPYLRRKFGIRPPGSFLTLRFVGIGQSAIDQALREHVPLPADVMVSSLFEASRVDFTFALPGHSPEDLERLKKIGALLRAQLGEYIYADDGSALEDQVVRLIRARGDSLVLVESGSGGHLAASLDAVTNIAHLLAAAWVAPTEEQLRQILRIPPEMWSGWDSGEARVKGLGTAARNMVTSQWAVVIGEIKRDASGAFVWLGVGSPDSRWSTERVPVPGGGEIAHANLTTVILDRVRKQLQKPAGQRE